MNASHPYPTSSRWLLLSLSLFLALCLISIARADWAAGTQITNFGSGFTQAPRPHNDGVWIYYQSNKNGKSAIFRMHPDGSNDTDLTSGHTINTNNDCIGLGFSADGSKMIYISHDGSYGKTVLANPDGTSPTVLSPTGVYDYMSLPNSNASKVAWSIASSGYKIQICDVSSGTITTLTPSLGDCYVPQFTKDNTRIVFSHMVSSVNTTGDLYIVDIGGTNLTNLTNNNAVAYQYSLSSLDVHGASDYPSLSPDGTRVLFSQYVNGAIC